MTTLFQRALKETEKLNPVSFDCPDNITVDGDVVEVTKSYAGVYRSSDEVVRATEDWRKIVERTFDGAKILRVTVNAKMLVRAYFIWCQK